MFLILILFSFRAPFQKQTVVVKVGAVVLFVPVSVVVVLVTVFVIVVHVV